MSQAGPAARLSFRSSVTSGQPNASAKRNVPGVVAGQSCSSTPTRGLRTARYAYSLISSRTRSRCALFDFEHVRCLQLVPTDAGCWLPRPRRVPVRPKSLQPLWTPPIRLHVSSRPRPRPARTHRRRLSLPVRITGAQNAGRSNARAGRHLAIANAFEPRVEEGAGGDPLQLAAEEFLHGLVL